jgi:hypothetical protein
MSRLPFRELRANLRAELGPILPGTSLASQRVGRVLDLFISA